MATAEITPLRSVPAPIRVVTAASLFDGHDAAINIMRRILQSLGAEVIHLGHDRSVDEIVEAAIEEDAHAVAVSSYQGGHVEFFGYLVERLAARGAGHIRVYGGGGGTIVPDEIAALHADGAARIFSPDDGRRLGLEGMIRTIIDECRRAAQPPTLPDDLEALSPASPGAVARAISAFEADPASAAARGARARLRARAEGRDVPVVGFTGTGGAGKSSVVDEIVRRFRSDAPALCIALLLVDPSRRKTGGALLGDRIRMNAISGEQVFARSLATRQSNRSLSQAVSDAVLVLKAAHFDLVFVETAGIGQSDSEIVDLADRSIYVMTPEYGAPSQLEKIDMLELADLVVLNKSDRRGAEDALRDVRKQWRRNHPASEAADEELPVFATVASRWDDPGIDRVYAALRNAVGPGRIGSEPVEHASRGPDTLPSLIPPGRERHLEEIAQAVHDYRRQTDQQVDRVRDAASLARAAARLEGVSEEARAAVAAEADAARRSVDPELAAALDTWPATRARYEADRQPYGVRGREIEVENHAVTLSGTRLPRIALPADSEQGALARFLREENLPGAFPFTAGVFAFKRPEEEPARMFAGEGGPERTNRRFHLLCAGQPAKRLSTAFDSVTLYGRDPAERPDIYGKVGTSGVSVCTLDDAKKLYSGFDLCDAATSVSMTINGPAPAVLAFFLNVAIDQQVEKHLLSLGRLEAVRARAEREHGPLPRYEGERPPTHDGLGLGLLGIRGDEAVDAGTYARIRDDVLAVVRGTVQADILKEDQAQNTCIFGSDFSLKVMGDIQEWFIANRVRNFYSVSISGYHIAEAGANPITQLAFTLANGFTYVEAYRARGMDVDDFAPNFSFFFSNGLDAEYSVIGRVARRIWAIAMRDVYGASERSQKLKYHVQTSGRSLHAQEMAFNDIRTTLQALTAIQDHCNSLHTNAYDEAVTTPTEDSVRRALAIQLIIHRELGMSRNENPLQGSHAIEWLTNAVEDAVLEEFERLSRRGGVLGAMETHYQRGRIQDESMAYEARKHSGELPIIGVNTFENPAPADARQPLALMRASGPEKDAQIAALAAFRRRHDGSRGPALDRLQRVARSGGNVFAELMETVKSASLGEVTEALFEVGGRYRRSM